MSMFFNGGNDRAVLDAIHRSLAVIEFKLDGTILDANENFLKTMGYTLAEVRGRHHSLFVEADHAAGPEYRAFWEGLRRGTFTSAEYKRLAKGGREVWIQGTYNPVVGRDGKPVKVVKFATDITAAKLRSVDHAGQIAAIGRSQAVIEFALDGTILDANANFLNTVGYGLEEVRGRHHRMFVETDYAGSAEYGEFWARLGRGEFQAAEFKRVGKDGREIWLQATYNPIRNADGRPWKVVKYATDITRETIRNADMTGQIDAINRSQAVIEFALDGTILTANKNFLDVVGYRLEEVQGRHHRMFVEAEYGKSDQYKTFWDNLRDGKFVPGMFKRLGKDGRVVWIQAAYNPILDPDGKPFKVVKYASDVTASMDARRTAVQAAERTLDNVQTVTDAAELMNASALEISGDMGRSKAAVDAIHGRTDEADASTGRLRAAAQSMGGVVQLISDIAQQINLLALNATIEAARAGEAGKGFAVVATEVKSLASQTTGATAKIATEIAEMQGVSDEVAGTLASISQSIGTIRDIVAGVAGATQAQSRATGDILVNMRHASNGVSSISVSLDNWVVGVDERRSDRRVRVLLASKIHLPDGRLLPCTIRDISKGGARINLHDGADIGTRFDLVVDEDGRRFTCQVVRRDARELGVMFV